MSTNEKEDVVVSVSTVSAVNPSVHREAVQARLEELRQMRATIPHFTMPVSSKETVRLNNAASVSPQFVESTASAIANQKPLERADGATPAEMRDLMGYAEAYLPLADEFEAMGQFLRHSIHAAKARAGSEALATYNMAKGLARIPRYAGLAVYVADMRRLLGRTRGKMTDEQIAKRLATMAARAKEKAARKLPAPEPSTTQ
jgi:hypothetical protein